MSVSLQADPALQQGYILVDGQKAATVTTAGIITGAMPAGAVQSFARTSAPAGWLICNGDAIGTTGTVQGIAVSNLTALRNMFLADSNPFGVSGGNPLLPDLRGIFVRGSGSQTVSSITYNKTFAAKEGDAFQGHQHDAIGAHSGTPMQYSASGRGVGEFNIWFGGTAGTTGHTAPASDGTNGTPRTASETRPANIALLYCIKY